MSGKTKAAQAARIKELERQLHEARAGRAVVEAAVGFVFYVVMQKRRDGRVYVDLHKCLPTMFLTREDAVAAMEADPELAPGRHVVCLVANFSRPCPQGESYF